MNLRIVLAATILLTACSSKSYRPQASFSFGNKKNDAIEARKVLHELAIENNLDFNDGSLEYPSGTKTLVAVAERADGLQVILVGGSEQGEIAIAIHCHERCKEWKSINSLARAKFQQHWPGIE